MAGGGMKASRRLVKNPDYDEAFLRTFTVPVEDWHWTVRSKAHCGYRWFRGRNIIPAPAVRRPFSAPRCLGCKRIIRIAGIHKIRTRGAQQFFDLLDRLPNHATRLAGLNLAF